MKTPVLALASLFAAAAAAADFEGVLRMKYTTPQGAGTMTISLSPKGARNEVDIPNPRMPVKMTTLALRAKPDVVYLINDAQKVYSELEVKIPRERPEKEEGKYIVKDLGEETVSGYRCRRVVVTHPRGGESELWTNRNLLDYETYARTRTAAEREERGGAFLQALKDAKADGFPVKSIHRSGRKGGEIVMELLKAEKKPLPASLFQVPPGYTKTTLGPAGAAIPPDARKAMEESMKNMTPEQRRMIESLMKKTGPEQDPQ